MLGAGVECCAFCVWAVKVADKHCACDAADGFAGLGLWRAFWRGGAMDGLVFVLADGDPVAGVALCVVVIDSSPFQISSDCCWVCSANTVPSAMSFW